MDSKDQDYIDQIKKLSKLAEEWISQHPASKVKIQFNFPSDVMLIGIMKDALQKGFVTANEDGMKLLEYMGANEPGPKIPTVFMIKIALEFLEEQEREAESNRFKL